MSDDQDGWTASVDDGVFVTVHAGTFYLRDIVNELSAALVTADSFRSFHYTVYAKAD